MNVLMTVVLVLQILAALVMIGLVLIQHGKGADMGASFGSGASGSLFGATGSANFLSRSTAVCATVFFVCTLGLAFVATNRAPLSDGGSSVLDRPAAAAASAASAAAASAPLTGAAQVPMIAASNPAVPASGAAAAAVVPAASAAASGAAAVPTK